MYRNEKTNSNVESLKCIETTKTNRNVKSSSCIETTKLTVMLKVYYV